MIITNQITKIIKLAILAPMFFMTACAYYPTEDGAVHAQPIGDYLKCGDLRNQHLPTCFCNVHSIKQNPERANFCAVTAVTSDDQFSFVDSTIRTEAIIDLDNVRSDLKDAGAGWLKAQISPKAKPRTRKWLKEFRAATVKLETPRSEIVEKWSDNTSLYLAGKTVEDDCDTADSLLDLAFALGGFGMNELVKILVDSNPYDARPADHYVSAVWVDNKWMVIDQQDERLKPLMHIELGGYMTRDGRLASEGKIIAYRKLNQSNWYQGVPPIVKASSIQVAGI